MLRRLTILLVVLLTVSAVRAQRRLPCNRSETPVDGRALTRSSGYVSKLTGQVRVPVVLAAFPDRGFKLSNEQTRTNWDAMLNQPGFSENGAMGCAADYFHDQSLGQFEVTFDVIGPVVLPDSMAHYGENSNNVEGNDRRPQQMIIDACKATGKDFSPYDWNGDRTVDAVIVVFAGSGENREGGSNSIWPHMSQVYNGKVGNLSLRTYACVSELRDHQELDGYGTLCHEFSHCLGLPDLYPVSGSAYSIFDEWDLMDGGNYANHGFGVPNYSAFERSICGWLTLTELSETSTITDMPSLEERSAAYVIYNDAYPQEYYILENRQQKGWDYYVPGNGLLVTHVCDYNGTLQPNTSWRTQVDLVPADNRKYQDSKALFGEPMYGEDSRNKYLSLAAYPFSDDVVLNDSLTDVSVPASTLKNANVAGNYFLSKPITHIRMDEQGHISFEFMKVPTDISSVSISETPAIESCYDLNGRRLPSLPSTSGIFILRFTDGSVRKVCQ